MHKLVWMFALALAGCARSADDPLLLAETTTPKAGTVVVELFQSQGCSSCPPANANVNALADRPGILALSFAVTYWDHLGWKDPFAQPAFTERQRAYARTKRSDGVYTPQVVINGRRALVGANAASLGKAIAAQGALSGGPAIGREGDAVTIGPGQGGAAKVLLVTFDPRNRKVPIRAGENNGKTLPHRNIVVALDEAGTWYGKPLRVPLTVPKDPALRMAVLLQRGEGGPLIAARKL